MICALSAAWLVICMTADTVKAWLFVGLDRVWLWFVVMLVLCAVLSFVAIHVRVHDPRRAMTRAAVLVTLAFLMSLVIGLVVTNALMDPILRHSQYLESDVFVADASRWEPTPGWVVGVFRQLDGLATEGRKEGSHDYWVIAPTSSPNVKDLPAAILREVLTGKQVWSRADVGYAVLEDLDWGIPGAPLSRSSERSGLRVLYVVSLGPSSWLQLHVFPRVLFLASWLAVFAGLFLQLILAPEPMTEPL